MNLKGIQQFLQKDIWHLDLRELTGIKSFAVKLLRTILMAIRGFLEDNCMIRASSLTFFSMLSIVPIIALAFAISKGFGMEEKLNAELKIALDGQEEIMNKIIEFSHSMLENTKGGLIAGVGIMVLLWSVMRIMTNIEQSFNAIWGIKEARSFFRKISEYFSIMLMAPIILIVSSSATVFLSSQVKTILDSWEFLAAVGPLVLFGFKLIPYTLIWLLFTFLYMVMPNTKVNFKSALIAGVVAGSCFEITQWAYVNFQIGASQSNAIYGSFAALPLFLSWLNISWLIVLFGAELSYANQNIQMYLFKDEVEKISNNFKRKTSILVTTLVIKRFANGEIPLSTKEISDTLNLPFKLTNDIIFKLVNSRLLSEIKTENDKVTAYQPAQDINKLTLGRVLKTIDAYGEDDLPTPISEDLSKIEKSLAQITSELETSKENVLLKNV